MCVISAGVIPLVSETLSMLGTIWSSFGGRGSCLQKLSKLKYYIEVQVDVIDQVRLKLNNVNGS